MTRVYVCFWFDTEDYVAPPSDDAAMRIARIFSEEGVSATFKLVGEKARRLRDRGREDVIAALAAHDIGYHTDFHSRPPTVTQYLEGLGWEEGMAEFDRRERQGLEDVEAIFGKRCSTYGQPGGAWAPHVYPVLREWGIPTYVDEAAHIGLNDQPFWYCGVLNVLRMRSRCTRMQLGGGDNLRLGCEAFDGIAAELDQEGGGLISIYYHPCEWATTEFWDGVNFSRGRNTPLDALTMPPLKPKADAERDYADFGAYLHHVATSGAKLVTCADLPALYPDTWAAAPLPTETLRCLTCGMSDEVGYQPVRHGWASAAESFGVMAEALSRLEQVRCGAPLTGRYLDGPTARPADNEACEVTREAFLEAAQDCHRQMRDTGRVPNEIIVGGHTVSPAGFAQAAARVLMTELQGLSPAFVEISRTRMVMEREVIEEGSFGWGIFPEGFRAPKVMELARLQAWTLKPALLKY